METIDNLHPKFNSASPSGSELSPLNFRLLLTTVLADRMAYYGLRAVIILYAIDQLSISESIAFYHYGYLTLAVVISQLIGGFLGDLILGARNGIAVGFGFCTIGTLLVIIQNPLIFYIGVFLVALGSGFTRSNTFSLIGHGTSNGILLERRFISMYAALNLGALLSTLVVAYIGEFYGFIYSFFIVLILYILSLVFTVLMSPKMTSTIVNNTGGVKAPRNITKSLLIISLTIITCSVFWVIFERYSMNISFQRMEYFRSLTSYSDLFWYISTIFLLILLIPYYFVVKRLSIYLNVAIGMSLIGLCWLTSVFVESEALSFGLVSILILAFIEALAELFVSPIALVILSRHTTKRYYGLIFGIYSLLIYFGTRIFYFSEASFFENLILVGVLILLILSIVLYSILTYTERQEDNSTLNVENDII